MIRSELDVLLDRVEDPALRADIQAQIDRLKQRRSFGLVFEQHIPERVRLPQHPIRIGSQVVSRDDDDSPTFEVVAIEAGHATLVPIRDADGAYLRHDEHMAPGHERMPLDSLVVITDFGEPVLPGFRYLGAVERGGDKPYHVVINGENHHALEALRFTHAGKVDCIYIDPPYNSGARDWKYNNDYVDETDAYRHSKWLAMIERRLKLARTLLKPNGVMVVTIDENEVHHLGVLLQQLFPDARVQMASIVINPIGQSRGGLSRVDEQALFVFFGDAPDPVGLGDDLLNERPDTKRAQSVRWEWLIRGGRSQQDRSGPNLFYPVLIDVERKRAVGVGGPLPPNEDDLPEVVDGLFAAWPIRTDGSRGYWRIGAAKLKRLIDKGYVRLGGYDSRRRTWTILYVPDSISALIDDGVIAIVGRDPNGTVALEYTQALKPTSVKTVWNRLRHNAGIHGSHLLRAFVGEQRMFSYPKSLYAVSDTVSALTYRNRNAVILDFFAGSGTTAHAVMLLNRRDGGRRQWIMVTNNEVSVEDTKGLRANGFRPGDPKWEALGIFELITRPRVTAAITGRTPDGEPIKGDYKFIDEFPMAEGFEENAAFLDLRYLDADDVDLGLAWEDVAPLLWLRAGATGPIARRTDDARNPIPYTWTDRYGVLFEEDRWRSFVSACPATATTAFVITHSPTAFAGIVAELPTGMDTVRLPDSYLSMFLPERGRA